MIVKSSWRRSVGSSIGSEKLGKGNEDWRKGNHAANMTRSTRSGRLGGVIEAVEGRGRKRRACDLNETIDENDDELMRAIEESLKDVAKLNGGNQKSDEGTVVKGQRKTRANTDMDADKENNGVSLSRGGASKKKKRGLGERREAAGAEAASQSSVVSSTQESPPIFAFKQGSTALKQRKIQKLKRREQEGSQRRIEELKAYFGSVDQEQLRFA